MLHETSKKTALQPFAIWINKPPLTFYRSLKTTFSARKGFEATSKATRSRLNVRERRLPDFIQIFARFQ